MAEGDIFVFDEKKINEIKEAGFESQEKDIKKTAESLIEKEEQLEISKGIPMGYVPISLPSIGKLGYPKVVHFRNYGMDELVDLSTIQQSGYTEALIKCLNRMIHEKYDLSYFHEKDLEVIMVTLFMNFQGKFLTNQPYYIDPTITDEDVLNDRKNIGEINIPIDKLVINNLPDEFADPFEIQNEKGFSVQFTLPRLKHVLITDAFIEEKFTNEDKKFFRTKQALEKNENTFDKEKLINIDALELRQYEEHVKNKTLAYVKVLQGQLIHAVGKKKLETVEEKLSYAKKIDPKFWTKYNKTTQSLGFGINNEYTFFSKEAGKEITRRFLFRPMDFIPTVEQEDDSNYTVHFGVSLS